MPWRLRALGFPQFTQFSLPSFLERLQLFLVTAARSYQTELPEKARSLYAARWVVAILGGGVEPRSLLRSLPDLVRPLLPSDLREFRPAARWGLVKIVYGNRDLHYEAWHRGKQRTIEVGLHFEADQLTNARLLGAFRIHERRVRPALPDARLEEWDRGWTRIWQPVPYKTLDAALQERLAAVLARYIATLEPILRDELPADVPWALTRTRSSGRRR